VGQRAGLLAYLPTASSSHEAISPTGGPTGSPTVGAQLFNGLRHVRLLGLPLYIYYHLWDRYPSFMRGYSVRRTLVRIVLI